jgi:Adenylate and Guanylate cyclase catalytic domain
VILFVDLVEFTSRSDQADPEDVRAMLVPYHTRVKSEVESFGGIVEKFIGDAVMAVFGAPVAHGDDAERAVRAGLRVLEAIEELNREHPELDLAYQTPPLPPFPHPPIEPGRQLPTWPPRAGSAGRLLGDPFRQTALGRRR